MSLKFSVEQATEKGADNMRQQTHCGPSVMHVMWEAYGLDNKDLLWASATLGGGLGGYRKGVCGALAAAAICLGLRNICSLDDPEAAEKAQEEAREKTKELAESFDREFGDITCAGLVDLGPLDAEPDPELIEKNRESKCIPFVQFCIRKLYELDDK